MIVNVIVVITLYYYSACVALAVTVNRVTRCTSTVVSVRYYDIMLYYAFCRLSSMFNVVILSDGNFTVLKSARLTYFTTNDARSACGPKMQFSFSFFISSKISFSVRLARSRPAIIAVITTLSIRHSGRHRSSRRNVILTKTGGGRDREITVEFLE